MSVRNHKAVSAGISAINTRHERVEPDSAGISPFVRELYKNSQFWGPANDIDFQEMARARAMKEAEFVRSIIGDEGLMEVYKSHTLTPFGFNQNSFPTDTSSVSLLAGVIRESMAHGNFTVEQARDLLSRGSWAETLSNYYNNEVVDQGPDDEVVATTLAMGEEGDSINPRDFTRNDRDGSEYLTTLAMGEEGDRIPHHDPVRENGISDFVRNLYKDTQFWGPGSDQQYQDQARLAAMKEAEFVRSIIGDEGLKQAYNGMELDLPYQVADVSTVSVVANLLRQSMAHGQFTPAQAREALSQGNWSELLTSYWRENVDPERSETRPIGDPLPPVIVDDRHIVATTNAVGEEGEVITPEVPVKVGGPSELVRELYKDAQFWGPPNDPQFQEMARARAMKEAEFVRSIIGDEGLMEVYKSHTLTPFGFNQNSFPTDTSSVSLLAGVIRESMAHGNFTVEQARDLLSRGSWAETLSNYYNNEVVNQGPDDEVVATTLAMGEEGDSINPQPPVTDPNISDFVRSLYKDTQFWGPGSDQQYQDQARLAAMKEAEFVRSIIGDEGLKQAFNGMELDLPYRVADVSTVTIVANLLRQSMEHGQFTPEQAREALSQGYWSEILTSYWRENVDPNRIEERPIGDPLPPVIVDDRDIVATTLAMGEEGDSLPPQDRGKNIAEEELIRATTLAMGEEGDSLPPDGHISVTLAIGEDSEGNRSGINEKEFDFNYDASGNLVSIAHYQYSPGLTDTRNSSQGTDQDLIHQVKTQIDQNQDDIITAIRERHLDLMNRHNEQISNFPTPTPVEEDRVTVATTLAMGEEGDSHSHRNHVSVTLAIGENGEINSDRDQVNDDIARTLRDQQIVQRDNDQLTTHDIHTIQITRVNGQDVIGCFNGIDPKAIENTDFLPEREHHSLSEIRNLISKENDHNSRINGQSDDQHLGQQIYTVQVTRIEGQDVIGCFDSNGIDASNTDVSQDIDPNLIDPFKRDT